MKTPFYCLDKFSMLEGTLISVKEIVDSGTLPPGLFDEFVEACLMGYADDLRDQQLSVLFSILNYVELRLEERELSTAPVARVREALLFVLENQGN
jgi:hypothetical protein